MGGKDILRKICGQQQQQQHYIGKKEKDAGPSVAEGKAESAHPGRFFFSFHSCCLDDTSNLIILVPNTGVSRRRCAALYI